ncbi:MAG TPA: hypothetical protein VD902_22005 [Symbiobacteriaceae bacterium]|nr:hypothetical protein [Symbiobacteriaceae bacterium]
MAESHHHGLAAMAECFAEEFARMGYSEEALMALFRNPFYCGPHAAYREFGEEWVRRLVRQSVCV